MVQFNAVNQYINNLYVGGQNDQEDFSKQAQQTEQAQQSETRTEEAECVPIEPDICKYIRSCAGKNMFEVEDMLRAVCEKGTAAEIVEFLRQGVTNGSIFLGRDDSTAIYHTLDERYELNFGLRNWQKYYR